MEAQESAWLDREKRDASCVWGGEARSVLLAKRKRRKRNCMVTGSVRPKRTGKREKDGKAMSDIPYSGVDAFRRAEQCL